MFLERWDGRRYCRPCLVLLMNEAEVRRANQALDDAMSAHLAHERMGTFAGCPLCAVTA